MKQTFAIVLTALMSITAYGQSSSGRSYFLNTVSTASTGSEIRISEKGDTILVSQYAGTNAQVNTQQRLERKYLGTPYYRNLWFKGQTQIQGGIPSNGIIAFNVIKNLVHFAPDDETMAIDLKPDRFVIDGQEFYLLEDKYEGASKYYYNYVVKGEPTLLRQHHGLFVITRDRVSDGYGNANTNEYEGKFQKEEDYYFVIQNQLVLVNRKRSFLKSLGPYEQRARKIIQRENLNLKKPRDIITLAQMLQQ